MQQSTEFWFLVKALKSFISTDGKGLLPVPGVVPDMKADTESFVRLQTLYRDQSRSDVEALRRHLDPVLLEHGKPLDWISNDTIDRFAKHSAFLSVTRYRSLSQEYDRDVQSSFISQSLSDLEDNLVIYVLLRSADRFVSLHHRSPGSHSDDVDGDIAGLRRVVGTVVGEMMGGKSGLLTGPGPVVPDDWIHELYVSFCLDGWLTRLTEQ